MTTYRTGIDGVTILREEPYAELVAVVTNGDRDLAERICSLLNGDGAHQALVQQARPTHQCVHCGTPVDVQRVDITTAAEYAAGRHTYVWGRWMSCTHCGRHDAPQLIEDAPSGPPGSPQAAERPPVGGSGRPEGAETISDRREESFIARVSARHHDAAAATVVADSCTCALHGPDPACPVHHGRKARGPKPPPLGPGCICDGSGRTCPRHGAVL